MTNNRKMRWNREDDIHSCSYYCTRPACVLRQRDELRDKLLAEREAFAKECDEGYACKGYTNGYAAGYENGYSEGKAAGFDLTLAPKITVIHAKDCWSWGPQHYECACAEIAKLRGWKK
jgi:hypothetical protein